MPSLILQMFHKYCRLLDVLDAPKEQKLHLTNDARVELLNTIHLSTPTAYADNSYRNGNGGASMTFYIDGYTFSIYNEN